MNTIEIDRLIADKILGYTFLTMPMKLKDMKDKKYSYFSEDISRVVIHEWGTETFRPFSPSTNIQDAWMVVDQFSNVELQTDIDGQPFCRVWVAYRYYESRGEADSMPMAVCLAALKSKKVKLK